MREDGKSDMPTLCPWCGRRWFSERIAPYCSTPCLDKEHDMYKADTRQQLLIESQRRKRR